MKEWIVRSCDRSKPDRVADARLNEIKQTLAEARQVETLAPDILMDDPIGGGIGDPSSQTRWLTADALDATQCGGKRLVSISANTITGSYQSSVCTSEAKKEIGVGMPPACTKASENIIDAQPP